MPLLMGLRYWIYKREVKIGLMSFKIGIFEDYVAAEAFMEIWEIRSNLVRVILNIVRRRVTEVF